ncbi:MAG: hypothetical protein WC242_00590 [Candidatus Paceibacterota bacterium]
MKKWLVIIHVYKRTYSTMNPSENVTYVAYSCEYETEDIGPIKLSELKAISCGVGEIAVVHQIILLS